MFGENLLSQTEASWSEIFGARVLKGVFDLTNKYAGIERREPINLQSDS